MHRDLPFKTLVIPSSMNCLRKNPTHRLVEMEVSAPYSSLFPSLFSPFFPFVFVVFCVFFRTCCEFAVWPLRWIPGLICPTGELPMSRSSCPLIPTATGVEHGLHAWGRGSGVLWPNLSRLSTSFSIRPPWPCASLISCPFSYPSKMKLTRVARGLHVP